MRLREGCAYLAHSRMPVIVVDVVVHFVTVKPMTDDPSSPSKKLVRETRTKNSVRMSCIFAQVFSRARNLFRVGHSSIPSKFLVRVSRTSFLDGELGSSVMGFRRLYCYHDSVRLLCSVSGSISVVRPEQRRLHIVQRARSCHEVSGTESE